jgi:hypothetical protein
MPGSHDMLTKPGTTSGLCQQPAIPPEFDTLSDNKEASTEEEDIPVLAVIPKTLIIEFGSEILSGKVIFQDAMAYCLQSSHEITAMIGSAWDFPQHNFNSKSIHVAPDFHWACLDKMFAEKSKSLVQESLLISHYMLQSESTDNKVIAVEASKAMQKAINTYLTDNPMERQASSQQTQTQEQIKCKGKDNQELPQIQTLIYGIRKCGKLCSRPFNQAPLKQRLRV